MTKQHADELRVIAGQLSAISAVCVAAPGARAARLPGGIFGAEDVAGRLMAGAIERGLWGGAEWLHLRALVDGCLDRPRTDRSFSNYGAAFLTAVDWLQNNPDRLPFTFEWVTTDPIHAADLSNGCRLLADLIEHKAANVPDDDRLIWSGDRNDEVAASEQYVKLDQIAAIVSRSKRTIENRKDKPKPDVQGGDGKPHEWRWSTIRPWLEKSYPRKLPERFPGRLGI